MNILQSLYSNILIVTLTIPIIGAIIVALLGRYGYKKLADYMAIAFSLGILSTAIFVALNYNISEGGIQFEVTYPWLPELGINFSVGVDGLSVLMLVLTGIVIFVAVWSSLYHITSEDRYEYYSIVLLFSVGVIGTFIALNLIVFYLFWELVLPMMFLLIGYWGPHPESARRAAIKFFVFTFVGSVFMLLGFITLILTANSLSFVELIGKVPPEKQLLPFILIFLGLAVKLPLVPLHVWLPEAHVEAPAPVSVLLAGVLLKMGGYGFIRIAMILPYAFEKTLVYLLLFAIGGALYSGLVAYKQTNFKRMIAYTSVNHMSYVFLGIVAFAFMYVKGGSDNARLALYGSAFEMFAHGVAISLMFLLAGYLLKHYGTYHIDELGGIGRKHLLFAVLIVYGSFAVFGFPLLIVFVGELQIFMGAMGVLWSAGLLWTGIVLLAPLIVVATYIIAVKKIVKSDTTEAVEKGSDLLWSEAMPLLFLAALILVFGVYPQPLLSFLGGLVGL